LAFPLFKHRQAKETQQGECASDTFIFNMVKYMEVEAEIKG